MAKTRDQIKTELSAAEDSLIGLKETSQAAQSTLEGSQAHLKSLESAETKDAEAIKAAKVVVKSDTSSAKTAATAVTKTEKLIERLTAQFTKAQLAVAAKEEKLAATAAKKAEAEAKKAEREANKMPEQNGERRPRPGSKTGKVWEVADELSKKLGSPVPRKDVIDALASEINEHTITTQYARWRKFHGVTGRVVAEKPAPVEEKAPAKKPAKTVDKK